ncbi:AraC family transcriptional regulator [Paenibacillus doosanensis]|uniref:helix-turn-helix transcriptional regulator n=1 Tax=Paenibacillus doosanensis TaxID=1229154 RepID=UPI00217FBB01|nr:AraC family transcriptional regulator [Paenibacillus doosanensis]MCS7460704.1 AraC family transcriptional regulator [Paenibacillus doosanensis]
MLPFYEIQTKDLRLFRLTKPLTFPAHMHRNIELLYVLSGVQYVRIDETEYAVHEGEAVVIFSDIVHSYLKKGDEPAEAVLLLCNPRLLGGMFPDLENVQPVNPFVAKDSIHEEAAYALRHIKKKEEFALKLGWTYVIMSHLLRRLEFAQRPRVPVRDMSQKIIEYLSANFKEPVTLDSLAAEFCVSKHYISHIFSNRIKMNLRNCLGMLRAEFAAQLIRTTDDSLSEIGSRAGFESQRTFNRVFHAKYGMSPREFRHHIRK